MKTLSNSQRALILLPILVVIVLTILFYRLTANTDSHADIELPKIQGIILKEAQLLTNIRLANHLGQAINSDYFIGRWHFITYGYTQCPDICPTTLFTLTQLADLLNASNDMLDTQFVFYTIDPDRDSQTKLAQYINYFSEKFVAMRANTSEEAKSFQQTLGIKVEITRAYRNGDDEYTIKNEGVISAPKAEQIYQVSHGLTILLINPEAELQAVFTPEITELGMNSFTPDILYSDYLKVIKYYQQRSLL
ncbi:SCO family protein [Colwellia piezophila]|uniref:SCO family protein n=1 Tax=Colwellia piezophila TaxID=211668 RepID=UPI000374F8D6|nr:SCO family protein [Colwellia piezophila]